MRQRLMITGLLLLPAPAIASDERRLSPAEVQQILDKAALKDAVPAAKAVTSAPTRPIEGEVGMSIGSGGTREVFGTAVVPVGEQGVAIISIDAGESRRDTKRRR